MNLIPFSKEHVQLGQALPFGLRDAAGRLLLAAGDTVRRPDKLEHLLAGAIFVDATESSEWRRRLGAAADGKLVINASLKDIAAARPLSGPSKTAGHEPGRIDQWTELALALDSVLRDIGPERAWMQRLDALLERMLRLYERKPDAALYWLVFRGANSTELYSSHHALLCALVSRDVAQRLGWGEALVRSLALAALTMNLSIRRLQDQLAMAQLLMNPDTRATISTHAERSANALAATGVADEAVVDIVRLHHDDSLELIDAHSQTDVQRAARVLRRVDIFTAKLSRRRERGPLSSVRAARDVCLGPTGVPDEIGAALLKALGLYPPGSYVELQSGEIGIVIARGRQANLPTVAALISAASMPLGVPAVRDCSNQRFAIKGAVSSSSVKVVPPHELLMSLR